MPRRDIVLLLTDTFHTSEFLLDHIRYALLARRSSALTQSVPWALFLDAVLPYAIINEKRDLWWPWRPRLWQMLADLVISAPNITAAVYNIVTRLPGLQLMGALSSFFILCAHFKYSL